MPRPTKSPAVRPKASPAFEPPNSFVASAARMTAKRKDRPLGTGPEPWQLDAWHFFDTCVDDQTQILTIDGWRSHEDIEVGTLVRTLDHQTGTAGWEPLQRVIRREVVDEPMLAIEMRRHSSLTTMDHRWPVLRMGYQDNIRAGRQRSWTTSGELGAEDQILTAAPGRDLPRTAKYDDALVELVGWFWTEGSIRRNRANQSVRLAQSTTVNPVNCASIEAALEAHCPGGWSKWVNPKNGVAHYQLHTWASGALLDAAPNKVVRHQFLLDLTPAQLLLFLDVSMRADGHQGRVIGQVKPEMLERYEFAAILAGHSPHTTYGNGRALLFDSRTPTCSPRKQHRTTQTYSGTVWCVTTPSGSWMARRNGTVYFTGNCGELAFSSQWQANAMSQVTLRLVVEDDQGAITEVPDDAGGLGGLAAEAMQALFDGDSGQAQMMAALGVHLAVPGESYLVGLPPKLEDGDLGRDSWRVVSNEELKEVSPGSGKWDLDRGDGIIEHLDTNPDANGQPPALIIRIWRSHPRKYVLATSPVRAALPVLRELEGLTKHVASTIDSRLAGAGILLVPSEMTFQTPLTDGTPPTDAEVDQFLAELGAAMAAALNDPSSPAARVPIVVKAPGQFLQYVQHITFDTPLDDKAQTLREEAIRRLALSLDMPPEVLLGQADSNHWSAWLISEDAIKVHVEPLAGLVTDALTTRYLWPAMQGPSQVMDPDIKRYRLIPDTSKLRQRSLDVGQTMAMHAAYLISDAALLRETRFDPGDAPTDEERMRRFTEALAVGGGASADIVAAAVSAVTGGAIVPMPSAVPAEQRGTISPDEELPPPGDLPTNKPAPTPVEPVAAPPAEETPRTPPAPTAPAQPTAAALVACGELAVQRAVERAWNRAGKRGADRRPVPVSSLDAALNGAWEHLPRVAATLGVDLPRFQSALDRYARGLLETGAAHDPAIFTRLLTEQVLSAPTELVAV